jgi:hypothetical protein
MANQVQRLPVIEWQPEVRPTINPARPYATHRSEPAQIPVVFIVITSILLAGFTFGAVTSVTQETNRSIETHRSYQ